MSFEEPTRCFQTSFRARWKHVDNLFARLSRKFEQDLASPFEDETNRNARVYFGTSAGADVLITTSGSSN